MLSKSGSAAGTALKYSIPALVGAGAAHGVYNNEHTSDRSRIINLLAGAGSGLTFMKNPTAALGVFATIPIKDIVSDANSTGLVRNIANAAKAIEESPEILKTLPKAVESIQSNIHN
jgi:hypothetical protein